MGQHAWRGACVSAHCTARLAPHAASCEARCAAGCLPCHLDQLALRVRLLAHTQLPPSPHKRLDRRYHCCCPAHAPHICGSSPQWLQHSHVTSYLSHCFCGHGHNDQLARQRHLQHSPACALGGCRAPLTAQPASLLRRRIRLLVAAPLAAEHGVLRVEAVARAALALGRRARAVHAGPVVQQYILQPMGIPGTTVMHSCTGGMGTAASCR